MLYGGELDMWDKSKWQNVIRDKDVLVMTPQILLDKLRHGFILVRVQLRGWKCLQLVVVLCGRSAS